MSQRKASSSSPPGKSTIVASTDSTDADLDDLLGGSTSNGNSGPSPTTNGNGDKEERVPLVAPGSSTTTSSSSSSPSRRKGPPLSPPGKKHDDDDDHDDNHKMRSDAAAVERKKFLQQQRASATGFSYYPQQGASCLQYLTAYISLVCYYHPWFCATLAVSVGIALMLTIVNAVFNPVQTYGVMTHDHSNIRSKYDLSMNKIDHWCLGGGNENCLCEDPLTPSSQMNRRAWVKAFWSNRNQVTKYHDPLLGRELDVAFVGESLVEEMSGRWLGQYVDPLVPVRQSFQTRFSRDRGARLEGVALGIAGDTAPNVLYRLMHGEMPEYLQPKVWWLVLGMNDLSRMQCSEEVTVLGILRVVEEILENRPNAVVVINSLLPMEYSRGGQLALRHDYQDSLGEMGNKLRDRVRNDPVAPDASAPAANDEKDGWRTRRRQRQLRKIKGESAQKNDESDDSAAETQLENKVRKKEGKRKRGKDHAVLDADAHKSRKYNFLTGLLTHHAKSPPLWTSVYAINKELKAFADKSERVEFFDATPVFTSQLSKGKYELLTNKISARGHPTPTGFQAWEDAIVLRLNSLLAKMKVENPDLFSVMDHIADDVAGLPNATDHPGYGFEDDMPPDVEMRQYQDDMYPNEEEDGKGEESEKQPDAPGDGGSDSDGPSQTDSEAEPAPPDSPEGGGGDEGETVPEEVPLDPDANSQPQETSASDATPTSEEGAAPEVKSDEPPPAEEGAAPEAENDHPPAEEGAAPEPAGDQPPAEEAAVPEPASDQPPAEEGGAPGATSDSPPTEEGAAPEPASDSPPAEEGNAPEPASDAPPSEPATPSETEPATVGEEEATKPDVDAGEAAGEPAAEGDAPEPASEGTPQQAEGDTPPQEEATPQE